ncbi:hypothetical protein V3C99_001302 [Haemonchus contortus]|uniref:Transposase n=1 Tax=Haemonchus contortus TaxID=6289 RepID=A0A7I4YCS3_HAECO
MGWEGLEWYLLLFSMSIPERSSNVHAGREINILRDIAPELSRRIPAAWGASKNVEEAVREAENIWLRACGCSSLQNLDSEEQDKHVVASFGMLQKGDTPFKRKDGIRS